jgi:hypothetical protein
MPSADKTKSVSVSEREQETVLHHGRGLDQI